MEPNSAYKVNKRVIVPWVVEYSSRYWHTGMYYTGGEVMQDLDRALAHLAGIHLSSVLTMDAALRRRFDELSYKLFDITDQRCESTFFDLRFFKKGTLHLHWKYERLWARFNIEALLDRVARASALPDHTEPHTPSSR